MEDGTERGVGTFGTLLHDLRRRQRLTQRQLADLVGFSERTLRNWEMDATHPRRPEMQSLLAHLHATPQERETLVALVLAPLGHSLVAADRPPQLPADVPALPLRELLRALRIRQNWTQERMAAEFGLERQAVAEWERGRSWPSPEILVRFGTRLCASAGERQMLWFALQSDFNPDRLTVEACRHQVEQTEKGRYYFIPSTYGLWALALQSLLKRNFKADAEAVRLLTRLDIRLGQWLYFEDRLAESRLCVERGLRHARHDPSLQRHLLAGINVASAHIHRAAGGEAAVEYLLECLPWLSDPSLRGWALADCAVMATTAGKSEQANSLIAAAEYALSGNCSANDENYLRLSTARVEMATGGKLEAWETILQEADLPQQRVHYLLTGAKSLLPLGARRTAEEYLGRSEPLLSPEAPASLHRRFDELTTTLQQHKAIH